MQLGIEVTTEDSPCLCRRLFYYKQISTHIYVVSNVYLWVSLGTVFYNNTA